VARALPAAAVAVAVAVVPADFSNRPSHGHPFIRRPPLADGLSREANHAPVRATTNSRAELQAEHQLALIVVTDILGGIGRSRKPKRTVEVGLRKLSGAFAQNPRIVSVVIHGKIEFVTPKITHDQGRHQRA
jgi:hypothetical protein